MEKYRAKAKKRKEKKRKEKKRKKGRNAIIIPEIVKFDLNKDSALTRLQFDI
jgi:hypothetical protein